jgi:CBS domain-containing protein
VDRSVRETVRNVLLLLRRHLWERVVVGWERVVGALSDHPVAGSVLRIGRLW